MRHLLTLIVPGIAAARSCCAPGQECWPGADLWEELRASLTPGQRTSTFPLSGDPGRWAEDLRDNRNTLTDMEPVYVDDSGMAQKNLCYQNASMNVVDRYNGASKFCAVALRNMPWIGHNPGAVAWPLNSRDVQALVLFANKHNLCTCTMSTGHDFKGRSSSNNGCLMIRTGAMRRITFSGENSELAHVESGASWAEVLAAADGQGRVVVTGNTGSVGVVGWTVGGGHGPLARKYGLGAEQLTQAELVAANGSLVVTNSSGTWIQVDGAWTKTAEGGTEGLLWALRGGGGSAWGILTALTIKTHPAIPESTYISCTAHGAGWDTWRAAQEAWRQWAVALSEDWSGYNYPTISGGASTSAVQWQNDFSYFYIHANTTEDYQRNAPRLLELAGPGACKVLQFSRWADVIRHQGDLSGIGATPLPVPLGPAPSALLSPQDMSSSGITDKWVKAAQAALAAGMGQFRMMTHHTFPTAARAEQTDATTALSPGMQNTLLHASALAGGVWNLAEALEYTNTKLTAEVNTWNPYSYFSESGWYSDGTNWRARYWGEEKARKLEEIKARWDPENRFACRQCIGDPAAATAAAATTSSAGDPGTASRATGGGANLRR